MKLALPSSSTLGQRSRWTRTALKTGLALALVYWLIKTQRFELDTLLALRPGWPLAGLAAGLTLSLVFQIWRWLLLVRAQGFELGTGAGLQIGLVGMFVNSFLPSGLGLDGAKIYYLQPIAGKRMNRLLSSVLIDRLIGLVALLVLVGLLSGRFLIGMNTTVGWRIFAWSALLSSMAIAAVLLARRLGHWPAARWLASLSQALTDYRHRPGTLAVAFVLSVAGHLCGFFAAWCAFPALGLEATAKAVSSAAPLVHLASSIPTTPMALGVTDSAAAILYPQLGLAGGAETVMLARGVTLVLSMGCAVGLFLDYLPLSADQRQPTGGT